MLIFPAINPVACSLSPLQIHWYGLMYLLAFVGAWLLALWRTKRFHLTWSQEMIADLIFYAALGVIIGGRVGYMLFYQPHELLHAPLTLFKIWQGGMSFHGGLIGVILAVFYFARHIHKTFWEVADFITPLVPFGLAAGRIGNFINGELWGRVSDVPWAMVFPHIDNMPRHPSQLYECLLEGVALFLLINWYAAKPRPRGAISAIFLMSYGTIRMLIEQFRQPDADIGFVAFHWLTMGQLLSIPMILGGFILWWVKRDANISSTA